MQKDFYKKRFLTKKYLKSGLLNDSFNIDFFVGISNLYFFKKYLNHISLPLSKKQSRKIKYWLIISGLIVNKFHKKSLVWTTKIKTKDEDSLDTDKKLKNSLYIKLKSNTLSLLVKSKKNHLNFYISNTMFDTLISKQLWYWNTNYFVPSLNHVNTLAKGYFFKTNINKSFYFKGYLNKHIYKIALPHMKTFKWIWL